MSFPFTYYMARSGPIVNLRWEIPCQRGAYRCLCFQHLMELRFRREARPSTCSIPITITAVGPDSSVFDVGDACSFEEILA